MNKYIKILLGCMILTSFYTHTIDLQSENLIVSRMTISDVFGGLAIVLFVMIKLSKKSKKTFFPLIYKLSFLVCFGFLMSVITSLNVRSTIFETLIVLYLILLSYVLFELFKKSIKQFSYLLTITCFFMSMIGLYDLVAVNNNWITVFENPSARHATSGFRYFAQAGNYSFTMLTIFIPLLYSEIDISLSKEFKIFLSVTIVLTVLFMIGSGAISIIISFGLGVVFFLIQNYKNKMLRIHLSLLLTSIFVFFMGICFFANKFYQNILHRVESRVTKRNMETPDASFIVENFNNSIQAFKDNVFFGTGLGGFVNNYSEFEIHGTYLKMLGETGVIGLVFYVVFLVFFIRMIVRSKESFLTLFIPFLIASLISWSYNYHFRKKEFWILLAFLMIVGEKNKKTTEYAEE